MKQSILETISGYKDINNLIIFTHNIDFRFLQTVVLYRLRKIGNPRLIVFADANCAQKSYDEQKDALNLLGLRYRIVPIRMSNGRFHPKLIFATGESSAHLIIGSGNLTYGGWMENGEIWTEVLDSDKFSGSFNKIKEFVEKVADSFPAGDKILSFVDECFSDNYKWVNTLSDNSNIYYKFTKEKPLFYQIKDLIGSNEKFDRIDIISPYYDDKGRAIKDFETSFKCNNIHFYIPKKSSNITKNILGNIKQKHKINSTYYTHDENNQLGEKFVHAKIYAFIKGAVAKVFIGSANCSYSALLAPEQYGNSELIVFHEMSLKAYQEQVFTDLQIDNQLPEFLQTNEEDNKKQKDPGSINISHASFEYGVLKIFFKKSENIKINLAKAASLDRTVEVKCGKEQDKEGCLYLSDLNFIPSNCHLLGLNTEGEIIESNIMWVDNEKELSVNPRGNNLADYISNNALNDPNDVLKFNEMLKLLNDYIRYVPAFSKRHIKINNEVNKTDKQSFSEEDIFTNSYSFNKHDFQNIFSNTGNISLATLIRKWFGLTTSEEPTSGQPEGGSDDDPDRKTVSTVDPEKTKKMVLKSVNLILQAFQEDNYFYNNSLEKIMVDVRVAFLILKIGENYHWITEDEFFDATCSIWVSLFFRTDENNEGYLEKIFNNSTDKKNALIAKVKSVDLTVSAAMWAVSPHENKSASFSLFKLASYLSFVKHPWLWSGGKIEDIMKGIAETTKVIFKNDQEACQKYIETFPSKWEELRKYGEALKNLENILLKHKVPALCQELDVQELNVGDLLWQGKMGFVICNNYAKLSTGRPVEVKILRQGNRVAQIKNDMVVPIKSLLHNKNIEDFRSLTEDKYNAIQKLINELICMEF